MIERMSTMANDYVCYRADKLNKPCSWLSYYNENMEADEIDLFFLKNAEFKSDGRTILFEDGSKVVKSLYYRKVPWLTAS